eukprot:g2276.t1
MLRQARPLKILHEFAPCFFVCWLAVLFGHTSTVKQSFKDLLLNDTWVIGRWWLLVSSFVTIALSMFLPGVLAQYISVRPEEGGGDAVSLVSNASSGAGGSSSSVASSSPASPSTPLSGSKSKFICGVKFLLAKTTGLPEKRYCGDHKPWIGTGMNKSLGTLLRLYYGRTQVVIRGFYYMAYLLATEMLLPNSMVGYE